jgi:hypothetical protein
MSENATIFSRAYCDGKRTWVKSKEVWKTGKLEARALEIIVTGVY